MDDAQKIKEYESVLKRYSSQAVRVVDGRTEIVYDKTRSDSPKVQIYDGEEWQLGDRAREVLVKFKPQQSTEWPIDRHGDI